MTRPPSAQYHNFSSNVYTATKPVTALARGIRLNTRHDISTLGAVSTTQIATAHDIQATAMLTMTRLCQFREMRQEIALKCSLEPVGSALTTAITQLSLPHTRASIILAMNASIALVDVI